MKSTKDGSATARADSAGWPDRPHARTLLTPDFVRLLGELERAFRARIEAVREARASSLRCAHAGHRLEQAQSQAQDARAGWQVPTLPAVLEAPGAEISGPAATPSMMVNALNPGPDGQRAVGYLDDDEDSGGHSLADTLQAAHNRLAALEGTLSFRDDARAREYRVAPGPLPFFMHRERGLHLDEPELTLGGRPVSATVLGTALTLFHAGRAHAARGDSIHFYLPKTEAIEEVALYRDLFDAARARLPHLQQTPIRAILLVESLPAAWRMEEMLHALGPYAAGLNAARWDLKASLIEHAMTDADGVWPDRFDVAIASTPFLANLFRRLVAVCTRHGAVAIGGMATALPSADEEVNRQAAAAIRADKEWEAAQGFRRGWVAHIHHMSAAAAPFVARWKDGAAAPEADPERFPLRIETPAGRITEDGTRRNLRVLVEYIEGWLRGRGAKAIDSLAGRPGKRPALMEDLATARISVAQTAQRVRHGAVCADSGRRHDAAQVRGLLDEQIADIRARLPADADEGTRERYEAARGVALAWLRRYLDLDFRSLGSYTRAELLEQAAARDPL